MKDAVYLKDLGERRIVTELILSYFPDIIDNFDDCSILPDYPSENVLLVTTDPCPTPVICCLEDVDYYHYGWMTILINVSDLAAMGATPIGIVISTVMPEEMLISSYQRYLLGLKEATEFWNCPIIGGNIKDGSEFTSTGSAFGSINKDKILRRKGSKPGDSIYVIGPMGHFMSAVIQRIDNIAVSDGFKELLDFSLYKPTAKLSEGIALAENNMVSACMDCSDGVMGAIKELAINNRMDFVIEDNLLRPDNVVKTISDYIGVDYRKIMLSWGDWQLLVTVNPEKESSLINKLEESGTCFTKIGYTDNGVGDALIKVNENLYKIANLSSERFASNSIFTYGLSSYLKHLNDTPLYQEW